MNYDHQIAIRQQWDSGDQVGALAYLKSWFEGVGSGNMDHINALKSLYAKAMSSKSLTDADYYNKYLLSWVHGVGLPISVDILTAYNGLRYITYSDFGIADDNPKRPVQLTKYAMGLPSPFTGNLSSIRYYPLSFQTQFSAPIYSTTVAFNRLPGQIANMAINAAKAIPIGGKVIAGLDAGVKLVNNLLGLSNADSDLAKSINQDHLLYIYDHLDDPNFRMNYSDSNWTSINNATVDSDAGFSQVVKDYKVQDGISESKTIFYPNVFKNALQNQAIAVQKAQEAQQTTTENIASSLKSSATKLEDDVKLAINKAIATQSTWMPWALGALAVFGGLSLVFIVLED